jgi:hypothetical protein
MSLKASKTEMDVFSDILANSKIKKKPTFFHFSSLPLAQKTYPHDGEILALTATPPARTHFMVWDPFRPQQELNETGVPRDDTGSRSAQITDFFAKPKVRRWISRMFLHDLVTIW